MVTVHKNETKIIRYDPIVIFEKTNNWINISKPITLSVSQTPEGDDSQTYASLDESTREAENIEYENLLPAHGYVNASPSENLSKTKVDCLLDI